MQNATLLIIDDEVELVEILEARFEIEGYKILTATNGEEGLRLARTEKVDLIITDVQMPKMTGIEMLEKLRAEGFVAPVFFISGYTHITVEEAYAKGVQALFAKPFDFKRLVSCVERFLTPIENRYLPRSHREKISADIDFSFPNLRQSGQGQLVNLGTGGFFINLQPEKIPSIGSKITFDLHFEDPVVPAISGTGIVRWSRLEPHHELVTGCGVEFEELAEESRAYLIHLINSSRTGQYIPRS